MYHLEVPHTTVNCYRLDPSKKSGNSDYLKFDKFFNFLNLSFYENGWIKWNYTSTNVENYDIKLKVSLAGLTAAGSIFLEFWLEELDPTAPLDINGYPVVYKNAPFKMDTVSSIFHFANRDAVNGGMTYDIKLTLDQQNPKQPKIAVNLSRWFRIRMNYRASLMNQAFDGLLNGYRIVTWYDDNGLQQNYEVKSIDLPFIQVYAEKVQTALTDIDLAYLNIPSFTDLDNLKEEITNEITEVDTDLNIAVKTVVTDSISEEVQSEQFVVTEDTGSYKITENKVIRKSAVNADTLDIGNTVFTSVILTQSGDAYINDPTVSGNKIATVQAVEDLIAATSTVSTRKKSK